MTGEGRGWVSGDLWLNNCRDGQPFGSGPLDTAPFDLEADFFAAESQIDSNDADSQRRNALIIRIQDTSNNFDGSNGLVFQLRDLSATANLVAAGTPLPVTYQQLTEPRVGGIGQQPNDLVRSSLYLYAVCPDMRQPLVGCPCSFASGSAEQGLIAPPSGCAVPSSVVVEPCPAFSAAAQQELRALCERDFADRSLSDEVGRLLGTGGSCLFLCRLGDVEPDQPVVAQEDGFRIDYGHRVAGFFSITIADGRAVSLGSCAEAAGELRGMFDFEVARGRAAQQFP